MKIFACFSNIAVSNYSSDSNDEYDPNNDSSDSDSKENEEDSSGESDGNSSDGDSDSSSGSNGESCEFDEPPAKRRRISKISKPKAKGTEKKKKQNRNKEKSTHNDSSDDCIDGCVSEAKRGFNEEYCQQLEKTNSGALYKRLSYQKYVHALFFDFRHIMFRYFNVCLIVFHQQYVLHFKRHVGACTYQNW